MAVELLSRGENGPPTRADGAKVGRGIRCKHARVERPGIRATQVGEWDASTTNVVILVVCYVGDQGVDIGHGSEAQASKQTVFDGSRWTKTNLLVSPRPRESRPQLAWTVLMDE